MSNDEDSHLVLDRRTLLSLMGAGALSLATTAETQRGHTRTFRGEFALSTIMPQVLRDLTLRVSLRTRAALRASFGLPANKVGLEMSTRWWETDDRIYGGQTYTDLRPQRIVYPSERFQEDGGVLIGMYRYPGSPFWTGQGEIDVAIRDGRKIHPQYDTEIRSAMGMVWTKMPGFLGATTIFADGAGGRAYNHLLEPDGRLYFAGDWLTYDSAWINSSAESAIRTVDMIHERARAEG